MKAVKAKEKKPQVTERNEVDPDAYNHVVSSTSMIDVRLIDSRFCVKPEYYDEDTKTKHKFHSTREIGNVVFGHPDEFFYVPVNFEVSVKNGNRKDLVCSTQYLVLFQNTTDFDERSARLFAAKVGIHAAYPYFRSFLASQSWASGAELPTLPILKQPPFKKMKAQK